MTAEFDFRPWAPGTDVTIGPFTVERGAGRAPGRGLRAAGRCGRRASSPSPATPGAATSSISWPRGADLLLAEASFHHEARQPARHPPHRHRLRRGRRAPRRRRPAGDHPRAAVVRPARHARRRPGGLGRAGRAGPPGRDVYELCQTSPASWTQIAICTRLVTCSLSKSRDTCAFTVGTDRCSVARDLGVGQAAADREGDLVLALGEHGEPQPRDLAPVVARVVADPLDQGPGHRRATASGRRPRPPGSPRGSAAGECP